MNEFQALPHTQLELFPDPDGSERQTNRQSDFPNEKTKNSDELPPDYWLKVSNKLMKKLDRELQGMPPAMRKATISEIMHLMAQLL